MRMMKKKHYVEEQAYDCKYASMGKPVKKLHVLLRKKFIEKTNLYRFRINESDDSDDNLLLTQLVEKRNN
jgi:hypothetical protein